LFDKLYSKLIEIGYHPQIWRQSVGVVLKKSGKDDYSNSRSYRIISLLNCLSKIAEKIIAERLSQFSETTNLLYNDQMSDRKQRSAIDASMTLLSDIELNKLDKKVTSCLFMNVAEAFDKVNKDQMLKICRKNKLSSVLCR